MQNNKIEHTLPTISVNDNFENIQKLTNLTKYALEHNPDDLIKLFEALHPSNTALILQFLTPSEREKALVTLGNHFNPEVLSYLDEAVREDILDLWAVQEIAQKLEQLEGQDAIKILEELNKEERKALLQSIKPEIRIFLEESLSYPEKSAGRLMEFQVVSVPLKWTVEKIKAFIKNAQNLPENLNDIFVVDENRKPVGKINVTHLFKMEKTKLAGEIYKPLDAVLSATTELQDIIYAFRTYSLNSIPVVDKHEKIIGIIIVNDIIDLIYTELQEDFLHSASLEESDFYENIFETSKARIKWLSISVVGATGVGLLIDSFQHVIAQNARLPALFAIISSINGVASMQVVTIIIRALLNREISTLNIKRTISKEFLVSIINSLFLGLFLGLVFSYKHGNYKILIIIMLSLFISMILSALFATILPILFHKAKIDPTLSSGSILNSAIDAISVLTFFIIAKHMFLN